MAATDAQVQQYVNERVRPICEAIRNLYLQCKDAQAAIDDVYANLTAPSPTWTDTRQDAPAHLMTPSDVLAWNTFVLRLTEFVEGTLTDANKNEAAGQYAVIVDSCVRPVNLS
jgi:hypothetical protein